MTYGQEFKRLGAYLDEQIGASLDARRVGDLLAGCWDALSGGTDTNMYAEKLWRIEQPLWSPPTREFSIERHGQTVNGSSRATVYRWSIDLEKGTARITVPTLPTDVATSSEHHHGNRNQDRHRHRHHA
jgi:hypothetical protein